MSDNLLKNSAVAFKKLFDIEYFIEIGRKGKGTAFKIVFEDDDFKHLAGIGKLTDLPLYTRVANLIFKDALADRLTDKDLLASVHFHKIADRLENLKNLEYYLDNNMVIFKWDKNTAHSSIVADYMLEENTSDKPRAYVFLKEKSGSDEIKKLKISEIRKENATSFFLSKRDWGSGQVKYTLLKNEKIYKSTDTKEILFEFKKNT